jgi:hypothetical protein
MITSASADPVRPGPTSASWWFRSADGDLAIAQFPNTALSVWFGAWVLGRFDLSDAHAATVSGVRDGALLVWALDELVRGSSPFRRVVGAAVLAVQVTSLVRR